MPYLSSPCQAPPRVARPGPTRPGHASRGQTLRARRGLEPRSMPFAQPSLAETRHAMQRLARPGGTTRRQARPGSTCPGSCSAESSRASGAATMPLHHPSGWSPCHALPCLARARAARPSRAVHPVVSSQAGSSAGLPLNHPLNWNPCRAGPRLAKPRIAVPDHAMASQIFSTTALYRPCGPPCGLDGR